MHKYQLIAQQLRKMIISGKYHGKLNSQRQLAKQFNCGRNTIIAAMQLLSNQGLIHQYQKRVAEVPSNVMSSGKLELFLSQSGFEVPKVHKALELRDTGVFAQRMLSLAMVGDSNWDGHLNQRYVLEAADIALKHQMAGEYDDMYDDQGMLELREQICRYEERRGIKARPENVLVVTRRLQTYHFLLTVLLGRSTELWVPELSLCHYYGIGDHKVRNKKILPFDEQGPNFSECGRSTHPKIILLEPTRPKPNAVSMSESRRLEAVKYACQTQTYIIEDRYCETMYEEMLTPLIVHDPQFTSVVSIGGIPTWVSPAAGISWVVADKKIIDFCRAVARREFGPPGFMSQMVAAEVMRSGVIDEMINATQAYHRHYCAWIENKLNEYLKDIATWIFPGSYGCIWLKFRDQINLTKLWKYRSEVDFQLGSMYGEIANQHLLLRYGIHPEQFEEGLKRLRALYLQLRRTPQKS